VDDLPPADGTGADDRATLADATHDG
jgi:hypothetical protein